MNWFSKLKNGLSKTSSNISTGLTKIFKGKRVDLNTLEELEELLIAADVGPKLSAELINALAQEKLVTDNLEEAIRTKLVEQITTLFNSIPKSSLFNLQDHKPYVLLVCGVNGNGKTTTIGKLAAKYKAQGKKVMLAACDTFRSAAVEQLEVWANLTGSEFYSGNLMADPASVAFQALEQAKKDKMDILIIDTAGRLHNKLNLMEELSKIVRVLKKIDETAPHKTLVVIDGTTGQNASTQVEEFSKITPVSGLIITKLDGTARGGIVLNITKKFSIPILAIGVGEGIDDLNEFDGTEFAKAMLGIED